MPGFLTQYGATAVLNGTPMPTTWYARGHLGDPSPTGEDNTGFETRRITVVMATAANGVQANSVAVGLTALGTTEDWTHVVLMDDELAGNAWWVIPVDSPVSLVVGRTLRLNAGALVLELLRWS